MFLIGTLFTRSFSLVHVLYPRFLEKQPKVDQRSTYIVAKAKICRGRWTQQTMQNLQLFLKQYSRAKQSTDFLNPQKYMSDWNRQFEVRVTNVLSVRQIFFAGDVFTIHKTSKPVKKIIFCMYNKYTI